MPNIFAELIRISLVSSALYVIFCQLHRPDSKQKRIVAYCLMVVKYPLCFANWMLGGGMWVDIVTGLMVLLVLAFLCRREEDRTRPFISAIYVAGMSWILEFVFACYAVLLVGLQMFSYPQFSWPIYIYNFAIDAAMLLWAVFYYYTARKMATNTPISFRILIILMPFATLALVAVILGDSEYLLSQESGQLIALRSGLFLYGALFGTIILVFNMCIFYLYVRLSVAHESVRFAQQLAHTPPVWTAEQGLSAPFIEKYQITPREQQVIETMLAGRSDKEIAQTLELAVNTVQAHLKHVYRKTGATGRFALAALVRGS
ncbi:MAG: helix-turn-helix transcriptional regulator [Deferribacteraceae bacterium]|jgi:DNA-binding CsgD family transcriptional regulator|nr:helix-turn-helix transcriptional regulator [Deferribacteraceae bacterium]